MTSRDDIDALLATWLNEDSSMKAPSWLLPATLARTSREPRRPRLLSPGRWLPLTMLDRRPQLLAPAAVVLLALLMLAAVATFIASRPEVPIITGVDGRGRIALVASDGIVVVAADGSDRTVVLGRGPEAAFGFPTWAPDGSRVAVLRYPSLSDARFSSDLVVAPLDGGPEVVIETRATWMSNASWAPDGTTITYSLVPKGGHRILVARADGSGSRVLGTETDNDWSPKYSPDGQRIAFIRQSGPQLGADYSVDPPMDVYVMSADGSNVVRLSHGGFDWFDGDWRPFAWSPDGTRIVFSAGIPGRRDIFVVATDGSQRERAITTNELDEGAPTWSPDGRLVAFYRYDQGTASLVVLDLESGAERIVHESRAWTPPQWTADGRVVGVTVDPADNVNPVLVLVDADGTAAPTPIGTGRFSIESPEQPGLVDPVSVLLPGP